MTLSGLKSVDQQIRPPLAAPVAAIRRFPEISPRWKTPPTLFFHTPCLARLLRLGVSDLETGILPGKNDS